MTRQEKRGLADEILVVRARKKKKTASDERFEPNSLVIGVNAGGCIVAGDDQPGTTTALPYEHQRRARRPRGYSA